METKSSKKQNPSEFLRQIIGKPVVVKLNSGIDYRGVLACLDGYMNIALEQTEEYVNGQVHLHNITLLIQFIFYDIEPLIFMIFDLLPFLFIIVKFNFVLSIKFSP